MWKTHENPQQEHVLYSHKTLAYNFIGILIVTTKKT